MKFGRASCAEAAGAILAHSVQAGATRLKKGIVLSDEDIKALLAAGIADVTVATLGVDDIHEDRAAQQVACSVQGDHTALTEPVAGRVNLVAGMDGLLSVSPDAITAVNSVDEAITLATLPPFARVRQGALLATVQIIPYGVSRQSVEAAIPAAGSAALNVLPFHATTFDLILPPTPGF